MVHRKSIFEKKTHNELTKPVKKWISMNNTLRRVTDAVRAADSAFCEDFYNNTTNHMKEKLIK